MVRLPLTARLWGPPPSSVTVYPSGSGEPPEVAAVTRTLPVSGGRAAQLMVKLTLVVWAAATVAFRGLLPPTLQLGAIPSSSTRRAPLPTFVSVRLALLPMG